jgi:glycine/D-amino acid oxidase-like deaminating enzyme
LQASPTQTSVDLLVVGGGVNGAGIARDAAGRGLSVLLMEKDDLACATSSSSSKLIHGGLRYLELYEFRLVAEALAEREVLLKVAAHLVWPARFVMPHVPELRPRWMIRAGLFLYDHLARRASLPGSQAVRLDAAPYNAGLQPHLKHGFVYSDCRVDDARLVIANAMDARERGVRVLTRTECVSAGRDNGLWSATLSNGEQLRAKAIVNAAGPWVKRVLNERLAQPSADAVRLVKGSHIVLPKLYEGEHAFILQNDDRRVVFMIPYGDIHTLVGTTDIPVEDENARPQASPGEIAYLCRAVNRYLAARGAAGRGVELRGVRPLYDDGSDDPSAVTRDYTLRVDDERLGGRRCCRYSAARSPPTACSRARAGQARALFPGREAGLDPQCAAHGQRFWRRGTCRSARCLLRQPPAHLRGDAATDLPAPRYACAGSGRRRRPGRGLRRGPDRARVALFRRTRMGADRRGRALAPYQDRPADDGRAARARGASARRLMKPLAELRDPGRLRGLLFDIDDTLTTDGKLTAEAYGALAALRRAGRILVPITGRPAGWCDHIARLWPVDAVVGENGAFYFCFSNGKMEKRFQDDDGSALRQSKPATGYRRAHSRAGAGRAIASDQPYRDRPRHRLLREDCRRCRWRPPHAHRQS